MEKNKTGSLSVLYKRWGLDELKSNYDSETIKLIEETAECFCGLGLGKKYLTLRTPSGSTGPNFSFWASFSSSSICKD